MNKKISIAVICLIISIAVAAGIYFAVSRTANGDKDGQSLTAATLSQADSSFTYEADLCYASHGAGNEQALCDGALNRKEASEHPYDHFPIYKFDTPEEFETFKKTIIRNYDTAHSHNDVPSLDEVTAKCNRDFFEDKTLLLVCIPATSGSVRHDVSNINTDNGLFTAEIVEESPQMVTMDLVSWFVVITVDDETAKKCNDFDAVRK